MINIDINSVKSLYLKLYFNEFELANATGFLVSYHKRVYLITNRHVVTGRNNETGQCLNTNMSIPNKLKVWLPLKNDLGLSWNNVEIDLLDDEGNIKWLEHFFYKEKVDIVAIELSNYTNEEFCYNLTSNFKPKVTENVFIIGYPFGYNVSPKQGKFAIWSTGTIASEPDLDLYINGMQLPAFLIDAKTRQGQSGSPVIYYNKNGIDSEDNGIALYGGPVMHEIGIYSGRINKDSDLGYVWKWSLIKEIIENN